MVTTFRGASTHTLDDKARLIVPKRFLDKLSAEDTNFVLTASQDECLLLIDKPSFEERSKSIAVDPLADDSQLRSKVRRFLGHAEDVKPDRSGRIVISEFLRRYMGLSSSDRQVVLVGTGSAIEMWSAGRWQASMAQSGSGSSSLPGNATEGSTDSDGP
jgi:MraZ protein